MKEITIELLSEEKIQAWFQRIDEMEIVLEENNPELLGPEYLKATIVKVRNYSTEIEAYQREINILRGRAQKSLNAKDSEIKLMYADLLANDPDVARMSSSSDRKARAENMLADDYRILYALQNALQGLEHVETVVKAKAKELKELNNDLKTLRSLMKDTLDIGSFYGQESSFNAQSLLGPGRSLSDHKHDDMFTLQAKGSTNTSKKVAVDPEAEELRMTLLEKFKDS